MPVKGAPFTIQFTAWNTLTNRGQTADAAHLTLRATGDGVEFTPAASPTEVDATNLPGLYSVALSGAEMNYGSVTLAGTSTTPNVVIIPVTYLTDAPAATIYGADGADLVTFTEFDVGGTIALPNVEVWTSSDAMGNLRSASQVTDALGKVQFRLDPGGVYFWRRRADRVFGSNPVLKTVPPTSHTDTAIGVVPPGIVGEPPIGNASYPRVSDLNDFLSDAPFKTTPSVQRLSAAVLAGIERVENECQRHFLAGRKVDNSDELASTRIYDPSGIRYRGSSRRSRGAHIDLGPWGDLARLDSVVYQVQGSDPQTLVEGTDYRAMPMNDPARGKPYTYLEVLPSWWSPGWSGPFSVTNWGSIEVTGLWGYATVIPADVWLAMISASALSLFSSTFTMAGVPLGIKSWTGMGGVQTVFDSTLLSARIAQWEGSIDSVKRTYGRLWI